MYLAKKYVQVFDIPSVKTKLISFLFPNTMIGIHAKKASILALLAINILHKLYHNEQEWPAEFAIAYAIDSLNDRTWVDSEFAKPFVSMVLHVFRDLNVPIDPQFGNSMTIFNFY